MVVEKAYSLELSGRLIMNCFDMLKSCWSSHFPKSVRIILSLIFLRFGSDSRFIEVCHDCLSGKTDCISCTWSMRSFSQLLWIGRTLSVAGDLQTEFVSTRATVYPGGICSGCEWCTLWVSLVGGLWWSIPESSGCTEWLWAVDCVVRVSHSYEP